MKITNSEVINDGEKELIDAITGDLDWSTIERIFREHHKLAIGEDVEYKQGDIVVHESRIAYKLEFEVKVVLSVLMDREGNYIAVTSSQDLDKTEDDNGDGISEEPEQLENISPDLPESDPEAKHGNMEDANKDIGLEKSEQLESVSPDLLESDPEANNGTMEDANKDLELEKSEQLENTSPDLPESDPEIENGTMEVANKDIELEKPEKLENISPELPESDPEAKDGTMEDANKDLGLEKPMTDDDGAKSEDGYEKVLVELDPSETHEKTDMAPSTSPEEDSRERISRTASQAREIMAELVEGS